MKRPCLFTVAALSLAMATPAWTQPAPVIASMSDSPCPPPQPRLPPGLVSAMLEPGAPGPAKSMSRDGPDLQRYMAMQAEQRARDWPNLCRYQAENRAVTAARVVFLGDSITENWLAGDPEMFRGGVIDRGIGGQTSPQMVLRFYQDVVALRPAAVHIMAGTNDLAGNTGPNRAEDFKNNIRAMTAMAKANGIRVILASIPPADRFPWRTDINPASQIVALNRWLADYAQQNGFRYVDYHAVLADRSGGMDPALSNDGVHPNRLGYARMAPLAQQAVLEATAP